jgi:molybdopterin molybdotransferase
MTPDSPIPAWPVRNTPIALATAQQLVADEARSILAMLPRPQEVCPVDVAAGCVLAEPIAADRDQPPFHRSTRDGYAVRAEDVAFGARLRIVGRQRAGQAADRTLTVGPGQALEIMTGAPLPAGADAVLMVEHASAGASEDGSPVVEAVPGRLLRAGENVVAAGSEARKGAILLSAGQRLRVPQVALAAACGRREVAVYARPGVATLATGDELVAPGDPPPALHQIYDSNSSTMRALLRNAGANVFWSGRATDEHASLSAQLAEAMAQAPFVVVTGGVSAGRFDLVQRVLAELGAETLFAGVRIQPGKPVMLARLPAKGASVPRWILGLPGNPVSAMVTFHLFGAPLVAAFAGDTGWQLPLALARLRGTLPGHASLTRFVPGHMDSSNGMPEFHPISNRGSGDVAANARADSYGVVPEGDATLEDGAVVTVLLA